MQLLRAVIGALKLLQRFLEDFGNVKQTDNIAIFVADGLELYQISRMFIESSLK